jgi:nicotinate-nucleotide adenylyltransferase
MAGLRPLVGVYGGTFDPPHNGHLILAEAALAQRNLSQVIWVLTRRSPHKLAHSITPVELRVVMLQAALEGNLNFQISRVEIDRPPPYYAVDTVRLLKFTYPDEDLVYLMGGDALNDLPTWHKPEALVESVHAIGVLLRPGCEVDLDNLERKVPGLRNKVKWINVPPVEISASMIRKRIEQKLPFRHLLPPAVTDIIEKNQLYQGTEG